MTRLLRLGLLGSALGLAGCGLSTMGGALGLVDFSASGCGAALGGLTGCDLKLPLAAGAKIDLAAKLRSDGRLLTLRSGDEKVVALTATGGGATALGKAPGAADLWAQQGGQDVDRLALRVQPVAQFAYSPLSDASGAFTPTPDMDADGTFEVGAGLKRFALVLGTLGEGGGRLLGRDGATWTLPAGLALSQGAGDPAALHFEFERPAPGSYPLVIEAREGGVRAKILIVVK
jgi:hypothetical protein